MNWPAFFGALGIIIIWFVMVAGFFKFCLFPPETKKRKKTLPPKYKYIVYPTTVISQYDKQIHWIGSKALMEIYGVKKSDCIVVRDIHEYTMAYNYQRKNPSVVWLMPRDDGDYSLLTRIEVPK